jgi:hypothetical protein
MNYEYYLWIRQRSTTIKDNLWILYVLKISLDN